MGIFNRIKQARSSKAETEQNKKDAVDTQGAEHVVAPKERVGALAFRVTSPRISEKAAILASKGTYVFNVPVNANKVEVRKAVEAMYKVNVVAVRTVRGQGKRVSRGRISGQRNAWKKALVTLKSGQKIELYEGV